MDHILVEGVCVSPDHYIGGERITSSATFEDISPIDETLMGSVAAGGPAEVEAAVVAAQHLRRLADVIESHTEELAIVETRDNGSLFKTNRESMVNRSARNFRYFAEVAERLHGERNVDEYDESHCCRTEWFAGSIAHSTDTAPRT